MAVPPIDLGLSKKRKMVGRVGLEPTKAMPADLQSAPFDHFGTDPQNS